MKLFCEKLVQSKGFTFFIVTLILINAIILGMETSPLLKRHYGDWFTLLNDVILGVFVLEALLKLIAVAPKFNRYFGNGWNLFDFSIIVLSFIPATGQFAMIARLARLLRVLRLISTVPELRLIISTLVRSIPSMGHIVMLMGIIFYIYSIVGFYLFHEHDPTHWGSLGLALLTLFRVVTLEDWTDVMYTAMDLSPYAWMYFVSFVVLGTFVIVNLFIAVVLNNLDEAKKERLQELQQVPNIKQIMQEITATRLALDRLEKQIGGHSASLDKTE